MSKVEDSRGSSTSWRNALEEQVAARALAVHGAESDANGYRDVAERIDRLTKVSRGWVLFRRFLRRLCSGRSMLVVLPWWPAFWEHNTRWRGLAADAERQYFVRAPSAGLASSACSRASPISRCCSRRATRRSREIALHDGGSQA
jgi:hypothetical protein